MKRMIMLVCVLMLISGCNAKGEKSVSQVEVKPMVTQSIVATPIIKSEIVSEKVEVINVNSKTNIQDNFEGYRKIEVDGGNLSGHREPNVVVDIGFGEREYYAYTNQHGQLIKVTAKTITLQDATKEKVLSTGRYYPDEAKVLGVESPNLDEGHVIADSLGGVANAYNITPQNSTLNRNGDQAYMEKVIRDAGGCENFEAIITYPNTSTQIPNHYNYTYTLKGNVIKDSFDNVNPDEVNKKLSENVVNNNVNSVANNVIKPSVQQVEVKEATVYITNSGKKYHSSGCSSLSKSKIPINRSDAINSGYGACSKCNP